MALSMSSAESASLMALEREAAVLADSEPEKAAQLLGDLLERRPQRLGALRILARLLMKQARYSEAIPHWIRIAEAAPSDVEPHVALGRAYKKMNRTYDAIACLRTALQRAPDHGEAAKLHFKVVDDEIARIADRIGACDMQELHDEIVSLEQVLGADPRLDRLKSLAESGTAEAVAPSYRKRLSHFRAPAKPRDADSDSSEERLSNILSKIAGQSENVSSGILVETAVGIVRECPWLAGKLAQFHIARNDLGSALDVYYRLDEFKTDASTWMEAAELAAAHEQPAAVAEFCRKSLAADGSTANRSELSDLLAHNRQYDAAIEIWRSSAGFPGGLRARLGVIRVLDHAHRDTLLIDEGLAVLSDFSPFEEANETERGYLVEIVRRLRTAVERSGSGHGLERPWLIVPDPDSAGAMVNWILGIFALCRRDRDAAVERFICAKQKRHRESVPVDFDAEIAMVHARFHDFGEARAAARDLPLEVRAARAYRNRLYLIDKVAEFCGTERELFYPECLIDVVLAEIGSCQPNYDCRNGHLLTVTSSLRQGGSERQTVTVVNRMGADRRVKRNILAVRSAGTAEAGFFLDALHNMPVELVHYGADWQRRSSVAEQLPQLAGLDRLVGAIDLLPHNLREEIIRLCALIFSERPQAVHLRQDLFAGALACAIAGVPRFIIHRGSLSPDLWEHDKFQASVHLRPMRHTYRRLLERNNFLIVNNSSAGCATDARWLDWTNAGRLKVVYNAVEFETLGSGDTLPEQLKQELGIDPDGLVVGGVFRLESVKRPMLWMEVAALTASAVPDTHFVILGDGSMAEPMREFARDRGLLNRLHMPGRIADVGRWFRMMDVNLLTSEREGLPNVLIEGQHFGVPAVSADVGGANETVLPEVTGRLVAADADAGAYAAAVIDVLRDRRWRNAARQHGPAFVHSRFSAPRAVNDVLAHLGFEP